ncbi:MAG: hypothetical protein ABIG68_01415, partial [Acidobacteriota bacterium]
MIRDETAFLSFLCMMTAIDALAGYWDPDRSGQGSIKAPVPSPLPVQGHGNNNRFRTKLNSQLPH